MRARILVALAIVLSCVTGGWAVVDVNYVYVGNVAGNFYRISSITYDSTGVKLGNVTTGPGIVNNIGVLPNRRVAIGLQNDTGPNPLGGYIYDASGDPCNMSDAVASGGWGIIMALTALPNGEIAYARRDGVLWIMKSDQTSSNFLNYNGTGAVPRLQNIETLADGSIALIRPVNAPSDMNSIILTGTGTRLITGPVDTVGPGWGRISAMKGLANGNLAFCSTAGGVYVTTKHIVSVYSASGFGNALAITELASGKIAVGNTSGVIYIVNSDLTAPTSVSGFGTVTKMAALPNGNFVVANAAGSVYFVSPALSIVKTLTGFGNVSAMAVGKAPGYIPECGDSQHPEPIGDVNLDCVVNFKDVELLVTNWLIDHRP